MSRTPFECGLPHRPPFVFVDEVLELEPDNVAVCAKSFGPDEPFFAGHFPGNPLVPGVILVEALAQTAGLAAGVSSGAPLYLSAIRRMKFKRQVRPGDLVVLQARKGGAMGGMHLFSVIATVGEHTVAEGELVLGEG